MASIPPTSAVPTSVSTGNVALSSRRIQTACTSSPCLAYPQIATVRNVVARGGHFRSSRTWTTSSGELVLMDDTDELEDRALFVQEYNRLAKKHGVRLLVVDDFKIQAKESAEKTIEKRGWLSRMLRATSISTTATKPSPKPLGPSAVKPRRSVSDIAQNIVSTLREPSKNIDLQSMVRLSGKSVLYLPQDHCPGSLVLPTCIRATAQHLAQHTAARGVFRIPGSIRIVSALFDYYCHSDKGGADVTGTVRCATLPVHIDASVHDVASTFKRLLSVLPGGILGTLSIFDAFVAINANMRAEPEYPRTKQTKVRARLIALAIGTIESQFRRELICAVFGLLSLIGRTAELAPREDENGRSLPTGDLMGYSALGIIFGPLLVGNLLDSYNMNLATPDSGLLLFPLSPRKLQKEHKGRRRSTVTGRKADLHSPPTVDKIYIANSIAEMLIANWRDIVRQMKTLGTHHQKNISSFSARNQSLRPSVSDYFAPKPPSEWERGRRESGVQVNRGSSPEPETSVMGVKRQRPRSQTSMGSNTLRSKANATVLSPTAEEGSADGGRGSRPTFAPRQNRHPILQKDTSSSVLSSSRNGARADNDASREPRTDSQKLAHMPTRPGCNDDRCASPEVPMEEVPPRTSSKPKPDQGNLTIDQASPSKESANGSSEGYWKEIPQVSTQQSATRLANNPRSTVDKTASEMQETLPPVDQAASRDLEMSEASQGSNLSISKTLKLTPRAELMDPKDFETMTAVDDRSAIGHRSGITQNGVAKSTPTSSICSRESQTKENNVFSHDQYVEEKPYHQEKESDDWHSINHTPKQFYAPMRIPLVSANGPDRSHQQHMKQEVGSAISPSNKATPRKILGTAATDTWSPASQSLSAKRQTQLAERVNNYEPSIRSKSQPAAIQKGKLIGWSLNTRDGGHSQPGANDPDEGGNRKGVRAMAAMFEGQDDTPKADTAHPKARHETRLAEINIPRAPIRTVRGSKSGPLRDTRSSSKIVWPARIGITSSPSISRTQEAEIAGHSGQRTSIGHRVAARAAAITAAEEHHSAHESDRQVLTGGWRAEPSSQEAIDDTAQANAGQTRTTLNLGTMTPHQEQPPVAQHLNLTRPPSSSSSIHSRARDSAPEADTTPIKRPGSASSLHAQIRHLQRQLDVKAEEVTQLHRKLEAQENSDVGTLSEQLREAKRESQMWKDRAEAAERRVKVFERFTAKLKGIREASKVADERRANSKESNGLGMEQDISEHMDNELSPTQQHVKLVRGQISEKRSTSEDSGRTEDAGVVTARIRKCLHGGHTATNATTTDGAVDEVTPPGGSWSADGSDFSLTDPEVRQAIRELLEGEQQEA